MKPQGYGIVEIRGERTDNSSFCCYQLGQYMLQEGWNMSRTEYNQFREQRMREAKTGNCAYRNQCPNYTASIEKMKQKGNYQLKLF